jgi:hypothetical protein
MSHHDDRRDHDLTAHECIDPELGARIGRLTAPDCPPDLARRLEIHRAHCAHCRLRLALEERVTRGLGAGVLTLARSPGAGGRDRGRPLRRAGRLGLGFGAVAMAAGMAAMLLLPPRAVLEGRVVRGEQRQAVTRPVADEVVLGGHPQIRWTALEGASRYDVDVRQVGGDLRWSTSTPAAAVEVPEDEALPVGERYRVTVTPVPPHAARDGQLSTSFRTARLGPWLAYRLGRGVRGGQIAGGVGLLVVLASAWILRRR